MFNNLLANQGGYPNPTVVAKFANPTTDFTTLSTTTAMPSGGSISRSGNAMLYDSTGKLTYAPNNLILQSQTFNTTWTSPSGGTTLATNSIIAPDGTLTAATLTHTNTSDAPVRQFITVANDSNKYILSLYLKQGTCPYVSIGAFFIGGTTTEYPVATLRWSDLSVGSRYGKATSLTSVGNGWYRLSVAHNNNFTGSTQAGFDIRVSGDSAVPGYGTVSDNGSVYIWGAQLELVTYQTTPSTYVATTTAAYYGPRFDYNPSTLAARGLLIEGTRTNLLTSSNDLTNATNWSTTEIASRSTNVVGPDGLTSLTTFTESTNNNAHNLFGNSPNRPTVTGTTTVSVYLKAGTRRYVVVSLSNVGATNTFWATVDTGVTPFVVTSTGAAGTGAYITSKVTEINSGIFRVEVTGFIATGSLTSIPVISGSTISNPTSYSPVYVGTSATFIAGLIQVEQAAFASSYIPTVASSVARAAETFAITGYSSNLINAYYTDLQTGGSYSLPYNAGTAPSPSFSWLTSLRPYTNAYADSIASPSWLSFSRAGNALMTDSTGELTYAPANMLTYSEQFDNAAWTKVFATITADATTAPNGTTTADKLAETTANDFHYAAAAFGSVVGRTYTYSVYAKASERNWLQIRLFNGTSNIGFVSFNLSTGVIGTITSGIASISNAGNGWYRCSVTATADTTTLNPFNLVVLADNGGTYAGTAGSGIFLWGAQLEAVTYETRPSAYIPTTTAAVYGPRYDFDPSTVPATPRGLLIEESRTNVLTYSEQFNDAAWGKTRVTATANATTAPDGTTTADKLVEDSSASNSHFVQNNISVSAVSYTYSIYAKASERSQFVIAVGDAMWSTSALFNLSSITASTYGGSPSNLSITSVGNGWYRCSFTATASSSGTAAIRIFTATGGNITYTGDGVSGVFIWGAQLEAGSFATSYIPTTTASVTRAADVAQLTGSALTTLTSSTFSALVQGLAYTAFSPARIVLGANGVSLLGFSVNSTTSFATFDPSSSPTGAVATLGSGSSTTTGYRLAISANATSRNIVGNNGTVVTTSPFSTAITAIQLGNYNNFSTFTTNGWVSSLALYNTRLPDAVLKTKSAVGAPY
jgi:hypothetical protein